MELVSGEQSKGRSGASVCIKQNGLLTRLLPILDEH